MNQEDQTNLQQSSKSLATSQTNLKSVSNSEIINTLSKKKIREIPNNNEVIASVIIQVCTLIGLREDQLPATMQVTSWIEGIRKYYSGYAPEELFLACELNHYGKFDTKVEHYGKFSIDYLSNCLKLYDEKSDPKYVGRMQRFNPLNRPIKTHN